MSLHRHVTISPDEVERRLHGAALPEINRNLSPGAIEARQLIEKARLLYEANQAKEKAVPDLKTALQTALEKTKAQAADKELKGIIAEWDAPKESKMKNDQPRDVRPDGRVLFAETTGTSRATFEHVRDNPGKSRMMLTNELVAKGHKKASVSSLLGQMLRQGQLRQSGGLWYSIGTEFQPIRAKDKRPTASVAPARKVVVVKRKTAPEALPTPQPAPAPQINAAWNAATILDHLSIKQARALYDELKTIFGA